MSVIVYNKGNPDSIMGVWELLQFIKPKLILGCTQNNINVFKKIKCDYKSLDLYFVGICPITNLVIYSLFKSVNIFENNSVNIAKFNQLQKPQNFRLIFDTFFDVATSICNLICCFVRRKTSPFFNTNWVSNYISDRKEKLLPFSTEINNAIQHSGLLDKIENYLLEMNDFYNLRNETYEKYLEIGKLLKNFHTNQINDQISKCLFRQIKINNMKYNVWVSLNTENIEEVTDILLTKAFVHKNLTKTPDFVCVCSLNILNGIWTIYLKGNNSVLINDISFLYKGKAMNNTALFNASYTEFVSIFK